MRTALGTVECTRGDRLKCAVVTGKRLNRVCAIPIKVDRIKGNTGGRKEERLLSLELGISQLRILISFNVLYTLYLYVKKVEPN